MMNIVNGGAHADNAVDVQEFMVMPLGFTKFSDALRCGVEIFHNLKKVLKEQKAQHGRRRRRRLRSRPASSNGEALDLIMEAIEKAGYRAGEQVMIALDVAATEFYDDKEENLHDRRPRDRLARHGRFPRQLGQELSRSARSKTAAAKTTGTAGRCSPSASATRCNSSATISS